MFIFSGKGLLLLSIKFSLFFESVYSRLKPVLELCCRFAEVHFISVSHHHVHKRTNYMININGFERILIWTNTQAREVILSNKKGSAIDI